MKLRLINRKTETLEVIEKRIKIGKKEMEEILNSKIYNLIVENSDLDSSYSKFKEGIVKLYNDILKV